MGVVHGHELLIEYILEHRKDVCGKSLIEIGTTREPYQHQGSTMKLAALAQVCGMHFITVDMDPELIVRAETDLRSVNASYEAICSKGEDFLSHYPGNIAYVYLDAFDTILHERHHSEDRKRRYREYLDCEITNEACWEMHLECAKHISQGMESGGVICIDDVYDEQWNGKGKSAIPFLLRSGDYEQIAYQPQAILLRKL